MYCTTEVCSLCRLVKEMIYGLKFVWCFPSLDNSQFNMPVITFCTLRYRELCQSVRTYVFMFPQRYLCRLAWCILFPIFAFDVRHWWAVFRLAFARGIISVNSRQIVHASFGIWCQVRCERLFCIMERVKERRHTGASVHQWRMIDRLTCCKHILRDGQNTLHPCAIPFICLQHWRSCCIYINIFCARARIC